MKKNRNASPAECVRYSGWGKVFSDVGRVYRALFLAGLLYRRTNLTALRRQFPIAATVRGNVFQGGLLESVVVPKSTGLCHFLSLFNKPQSAAVLWRLLKEKGLLFYIV